MRNDEGNHPWYVHGAAPVLGFLVALSSGCVVSARPVVQSSQSLPQRTESRASAVESAVRPPSGEWIEARFTDLPIPKGFTLITDESFVFLQGSLRTADINYLGAGAVSDLIRFYQKSMPTSGWRFVRLMGVKMKTLSYRKGDEVCEIMIERHGCDHHGDCDGRDEGHPTHLHVKLNTP